MRTEVGSIYYITYESLDYSELHTLGTLNSVLCPRSRKAVLSTLWMKDEPELASNTSSILNYAPLKVYDNDQRNNTTRK